MDDQAIREQVAREHVLYEAHALWTSALEHGLLHAAATVAEGRARNAHLEACLVHARLLAEFLDGSPSNRYQDAHARYYSPSWSSTSTLTQTERDWINWKVMHLSAYRARLSGGLDLVETAERVFQVLGNFIGTIPDPTVRGWFSPVVHERAEFARERQRLESRGQLPRLVATTSPTYPTVAVTNIRS